MNDVFPAISSICHDFCPFNNLSVGLNRKLLGNFVFRGGFIQWMWSLYVLFLSLIILNSIISIFLGWVWCQTRLPFSLLLFAVAHWFSFYLIGEHLTSAKQLHNGTVKITSSVGRKGTSCIPVQF